MPRTKSRLFQRLVIHFRLRRERDHRKERSASHIGLDIELATELSQARPHSIDPHTEMLWLAGRRHIHDASPIVADAEKQTSGALPDNEAYTGGHGVPLDIRHRLLNDAQNGSLQIERQVVYRAGDPYDGFEAGAPAKALDELSQGCAQPLPLEIGGMKQIA